MITSAVSLNSAVSASTTSIKKSALKKPKKDVSVSFKQMPDSDTVENEQESVNINSYDDDSHEESEDFTNGVEEKINDKHVEDAGQDYEEWLPESDRLRCKELHSPP